MTTQEYISRDEYVSLARIEGGTQEERETRSKWYEEIIRHSVLNKLRLIEIDPKSAYKTFELHQDLEGFGFIEIDPEIDEQTKAYARRRLESLLTFRKDLASNILKERLKLC
jgi:hypothetical protein